MRLAEPDFAMPLGFDRKNCWHPPYAKKGLYQDISRYNQLGQYN